MHQRIDLIRQSISTSFSIDVRLGYVRYLGMIEGLVRVEFEEYQMKGKKR